MKVDCPSVVSHLSLSLPRRQTNGPVSFSLTVNLAGRSMIVGATAVILTALLATTGADAATYIVKADSDKIQVNVLETIDQEWHVQNAIHIVLVASISWL